MLKNLVKKTIKGFRISKDKSKLWLDTTDDSLFEISAITAYGDFGDEPRPEIEVIQLG